MNIKLTTLALFSCVALSVAGCTKSDSNETVAHHHHEAHESHIHADNHADDHGHENHGHEESHALHHDHANFPHSCSVMAPMGMARVFTKANLVIVGTATAPTHVEGDVYRTTLNVERVLKGAAAGEVTLTIIADHGKTGIRSGERMMLALSGGDSAATLNDIGNGVVLVDRPECAGAEGMIATLSNDELERVEQKDALMNAIVNGGEITRYRALLDFSEKMRATMTADDFGRLAQKLTQLERYEPSMHYLIYQIAFSADAVHTGAMMDLVNTDARMKVFEDLARVSKIQGISSGVVSALEPYLTVENDPEVRRIAAFVLARTTDELAQDQLVQLLDDKDQDIVAEAMIGLAGKGNARVRSMALDTINSQLASEKVAFNEAPIGSIIRNRQLQAARHEWHSGKDFSMMAAGYVLSRSTKVQDHNWMRNRLPFVENFGVRKFIEAKIEGQYQDYDSIW